MSSAPAISWRGSRAKPATLSTELTSALDAPRRALTAVLNARLISRISMLIAAVRRSMADLGISCPLMIVKGDGTLALAEHVALRPIETVLSGPAASLVGASWLCGLKDFIMSDMGGTTTDLGILLDGRPQVAEQGAEVGGWRTMVKAIDVKTIGLAVTAKSPSGSTGGSMWAAARGAGVAARLALSGSAGDAGSRSCGHRGRLHAWPLRAPALRRHGCCHGGGQCAEAEILALVDERPKSIRKVAVSSAAQRALASLKRKGLVQTGGFTPSDAAHVLGLQDNWPGPAAEVAARLMVRFRDMKMGTRRGCAASARRCGRKRSGAPPASSSIRPSARASATMSWSRR